MMIKHLFCSVLCLCLLSMPVFGAQDPEAQQADKEAQEIRKRKQLATRAYALLNELTLGLQALRLPENRIRAEVNIAWLLWQQDENRGRDLLQQATNDLAGLIKGISGDGESVEEGQLALSLRQEMLQTFISCDPKLALEFLRATRIPPTLAPSWAQSNEMEMEGQIASVMASKDPELALATAQSSLVDGFSWHLVQTFNQLLGKDGRAAAKLLEDIVQRLASEELLSNQQASSIAISLLDVINQYAANSQSGTRDDENTRQAAAFPERPVKKLSEMVIRAALKVDIGPSNNDPNERGMAVNILTWFASRASFAEKYAPSLLQELRKKSAQFQPPVAASGPNFGQLVESASPEALVSAAASAPAYQRNDYYYQASIKAANLGNGDQAVQIIESQVKDPGQRQQYLQNLVTILSGMGKVDEAQKIAESKISAADLRHNLLVTIQNQKIANILEKGNLEEAQAIALRLPVEQRIGRFVEMVNRLLAGDKKEEARKLLERAWSMVPARAANHGQLQLQLSMIPALAAVDMEKASGHMQSIINQLNDMLRAVEAINGFDVRYYKNDELLMQGGTLLSLVQQIGYTLALIAALDFDAAILLAEQFQRPEAKLQARLTMATQLIQNSIPPTVTIRRLRIH